MTKSIVKFSEVMTREEFKSGQLYFDTPNNLRGYFLWIKERFDGGEQYPYDLEELVGIAFTSKQKAVEALKRDFTQPIDFTRSTQKLSGNPIPKDTYRLSPLCFESMVARRCQPVMEIYVKIFHAVTSPSKESVTQKQPMSAAEAFMAQAQIMLDHERRVATLEAKQKELAERQRVTEMKLEDFSTGAEHFSITAYAKIYRNGYQISNSEANADGRQIAKLAKNAGINLGTAPHPIYGTVNTYPKALLDEFYRGEFTPIH